MSELGHFQVISSANSLLGCLLPHYQVVEAISKHTIIAYNNQTKLDPSIRINPTT